MSGTDYRKVALPDGIAQQLERALFLASVLNRHESVCNPTPASRRLDCWERLLAEANCAMTMAFVDTAMQPHDRAAYDALEAAGWRCACGHSAGIGYVAGRVCCERCRGRVSGAPAGDRGSTGLETHPGGHWRG